MDKANFKHIVELKRKRLRDFYHASSDLHIC